MSPCHRLARCGAVGARDEASAARPRCREAGKEREGPAIEPAGLGKYYGRKAGVNHLDLTVRRGEIFGFLGPNGAGKTTTVRCGPALTVSVAARHRAQVIGATIALGAVGFAVNFIAMAWHRAAPLRYLSPFHYCTPGDALAHGTIAWGPFAVLMAVGFAGIAAALPLLLRRDLAP